MATIKENLIAAKALIDTPEKWRKDKYVDGHGCMCAVGAVRRVTGENYSDLEKYLDSVIYAASNGDFDILEEFNDAEATSHNDIMEFFDRAISAQDDAP